MTYENKTAIVIGAGISGMTAYDALVKSGAKAVLYDGNGEGEATTQTEKNGYPVMGGKLPQELFDEADLMVLSPGVPTDIKLVVDFKAKGGEVIGEIELAYTLGKGKLYAVTGTNGKTTTTTLLGELMKAAHPHVDVVGNIGNPYAVCALSQTDDSVTVAELSSFQLETVKTLHPAAAVLTNITEDHLNRHYTMENYINCKKNVVMNQTEDDCCILNYEDEVLREFGKELKSKVIYFSSMRVLDAGIYLDGDTIVYNDGCQKIEVIKTDELQLVGLHNFENVMCAAAVAIYDGMDLELIRKVLKEFKGVEHRIEFVEEIDGVKYYNDSKGTNPAAAIKGISAMKWPTLLIAGGYDKHSAFEEWIESFDGKVKYLVLIGQTKELIKTAALNCNFPEEKIIVLEDLKEAVDFCKKNAVSGDAVLLSPACASWGQFQSYEQRGDIFKEYVRN